MLASGMLFAESGPYGQVCRLVRVGLFYLQSNYLIIGELFNFWLVVSIEFSTLC